MKNKEKRTFLALFYVSMMIMSIIPLGISILGSISSDPPSSGDWIVEDVTTISGQTITMNGSIVVTNGGSLSVSGSTIILAGFDGGVAGGEWNITVNKGGSLTLTNSHLTTDDASYHSYLYFNGSDLTITSTSIERFTFDSSINIIGRSAT